VAIVPVEGDDRMHLVQQFRYPVRGRYWEIPQGSWEHAPETDPLEVARAELREETGLDATQMTYAGHLFQGYGYATQGYHVFLAESLTLGHADKDQEEQDLLTCAFTLSHIEDMIREGDIKDATTVAALGLLRLKGLL
jgi:ADP-ribose pyrophosphatase